MSGQQADISPGMRVTTLRFPAADYARLREIAEANHRTVSQEMRSIVAARIAECAAGPMKDAA